MDNFLKTFTFFWKKFGITSEDSKEKALKKQTLTIISFLICIAGIIWGLMYFFMGVKLNKEFYLTAIFPFAYSFLVGVSLIFFYFQKNFNFFLRIELLLILLLPFLAQLSLGGFASSGVVIIWALLCPMGALMFKGIKEFRFWFIVYISLIAILIYFDTDAVSNASSRDLIISEGIKLLFFGMNIIAVSTIALSTTLYFLNEQRNEKEKNVELLELSRKNELQINIQKKEIVDSITYAKNIQDSILPDLSLVDNYFDDFFVFFKPKDIVSGDFYWLYKKEDILYFAVSDCTGHGVPGAMVSVVCSNALNLSILDNANSKPSEILDKTRELIIRRFSRPEQEIKDGMDISLCALHLKTKKMQWAGANNPLWVIRSGTNEVDVTQGDLQPMGVYVTNNPYKNHYLELNKGDSVYLFSDGFPDQFGGKKGKKYKSANFKRFLLSIADKDMGTQHNLLSEEFNRWKGDLEQIDDVCIMGVRI